MHVGKSLLELHSVPDTILTMYICMHICITYVCSEAHLLFDHNNVCMYACMYVDMYMYEAHLLFGVTFPGDV